MMMECSRAACPVPAGLREESRPAQHASDRLRRPLRGLSRPCRNRKRRRSLPSGLPCVGKGCSSGKEKRKRPRPSRAPCPVRMKETGIRVEKQVSPARRRTRRALRNVGPEQKLRCAGAAPSGPGSPGRRAGEQVRSGRAVPLRPLRGSPPRCGRRAPPARGRPPLRCRNGAWP